MQSIKGKATIEIYLSDFQCTFRNLKSYSREILYPEGRPILPSHLPWFRKGNATFERLSKFHKPWDQMLHSLV